MRSRTELCCVLAAVLAFGVFFSGLATAEPVKLRLLWWLSSSVAAEMANNLKIIDRFEELNPDIEVETMTADYHEITSKTKILAATGDAPDVVWIQSDFYGLAMDGFLLELDGFMERDEQFDAENFLPGVLESCVIDGKHYALHRDVWTPNVFYNVDWFEAAGIPAPQDGWTYDDLLDIAKKLTDPQEQKFGFSGIDTNRESIVASFGGRWMNDNRTKFLLHEPQAIEAIRYMHGFRWIEHAEPQPGELSDWWEPQWTRGDVAMMWWGPWAWPAYSSNLSFRWDEAPPVAGPAGVHCRLNGLRLGILAGTKHPQEAWRLLRFLGHDEPAQTMQVRLGIANPTVRYPTTLQAFYESEVAPPSVHNHIEALLHGSFIRPVNPEEVRQVIEDAFTAIMNDEQDAVTAITEAEERAEVLLREILAKYK